MGQEVGNPRIDNVTETWQYIPPNASQDGDTHVYDMSPERDEDVNTTLSSSKLGEDFYGYNHPNKRFTGKFDEDGNYTGVVQYRGGEDGQSGGGRAGYYGGYGYASDQYYNGHKAQDKNNPDPKHPHDWWNHLQKDQFEGMVSANNYDASWKDRFESQYSREEIDSMSPLQRRRAVKEILDDGARVEGENVYREHHKSTDDKAVGAMLGSINGVKSSVHDSDYGSDAAKDSNKG